MLEYIIPTAVVVSGVAAYAYHKIAEASYYTADIVYPRLSSISFTQSIMDAVEYEDDNL